jgi:hypothetical protein
MHRAITIFLAVLVLFLIVERLITAEYVAFLERDIRIEQAHRNLRIGMSEDEVMNLFTTLPPDGSFQVEGAPGHFEKSWVVENHVGTLHKLLGIEARDRKSYMELHLQFGPDKKLERIYYGG